MNKHPNIRMISITQDNSNNVNGNRKLLVFIHGWPDYADLWGNLINQVYNDFDCLLIELPNYNNKNERLSFLFGDKIDNENGRYLHEPNEFGKNVKIMYHISNNENGIVVSSEDCDKVASNAFNRNSWGWDMCDIINSVNNGVSNYVSKFRGNDKNVSLIIHDWGSVVGLSLYHTIRLRLAGYDKPKYNIERIAAFDVGDGKPDKMTFKFMVIVVLYQWYNIIVFFLPSFIANPLLKLIVKMFKTPLYRQSRMMNMDHKMNYQYFYFWMRLLFGSTLYKLFNIRQIPTIGKVPDVPLWFGYGQRNPIKFHTKNKWGKEIVKRNNAEPFQGCYIYQGYDCDHWMQYAKPNELAKIVISLKQWLRQTDMLNLTCSAHPKL